MMTREQIDEAREAANRAVANMGQWADVMPGPNDLARKVLALADEVERIRSHVAALRRACEASEAAWRWHTTYPGLPGRAEAVKAMESFGWLDESENPDRLVHEITADALAMTATHEPR